MKFGSDFSWLWVAFIRIFTAPFYIILWCINVVKSAVGMFLFWIIGKICLTLVLLALLAGVHYLFKESSEKFLSAILGWYYPNIMTMIVLTLLVATVRTIYREEFDEL